MTSISSAYGELWGPQRKNGVQYVRDGRFYNAKLEEVDADGNPVKAKAVAKATAPKAKKPVEAEVAYDLGAIETLEDFDAFVDFLDDADLAGNGKGALDELERFAKDYCGIKKFNRRKKPENQVKEVRSAFQAKLEASIE